MRNVSEIQRRLIQLGFLAPGEDDGKFGQKSLDAYNHFLANQGKPPHKGMILLAELNAELFPSEQPAPKKRTTIHDLLTTAAIGAALNQLKGTIPMNFLVGSGTAITGTIMIVVGAGSLLSMVVPLGIIPGFQPLDPGAAVNSITTGFGFLFLRRAVATNGAGK